MIRSLRGILNPAGYHGHGKRPPFFEGWYYKLVDAGEQHRLAVIPGIFLSEDPAKHHAFVQFLDGRTGRVTYHRYPAEEFWASEGDVDDAFELHVGPNRFTAEGFSLDIESAELVARGTVGFGKITPWPVTLTSPGIMGWYAWVPFMECYHGIVSLDHEIEGGLAVDGRYIDFSGGRGYTEKDWGQAFPEAWVWYQTNHFGESGTSLTASVAIIPWIRRSFPGFIVGLWHGGSLYRFATYTGARIEALEIAEQRIKWVLRDRRYRLEMLAIRSDGSLLRAPTPVDMSRRIPETLNGTIEVSLYAVADGSSRLMFQDTGRHAGLEVVGDVARLQAMWLARKSDT
jgi:hypothetical protein